MLDVDGHVTSWNPGAEQIKGYRADEILGRHFAVFYPPERVVTGDPDNALREAARVGYHLDQGWRVRKDGSRFFADVAITALRASDGRLRGFAKVTRDETDARTRQERASRRFSDLCGVIPVGIALFDESGRVVDANDTLCRLLCLERDHLRGTHAADLLHPQDRDEPLLGSRPNSPADEAVHRVLARSDELPLHCDVRTAVSVHDDGSRFWLVAFQDVTDRQQQTERLRYEATHDALTGLPNRRAVRDLLGELMHGPDAERVAVLFCDVNNFKRINDSLGHDAGDEVVVELARRLREGVPPCCTAARLSGDEFVVVCPDVGGVGGLSRLAEVVSGVLRTAVPVRGQLVRVSAAVGGVVGADAAGRGEDLLRFADAAMYRAKRGGPGRVSLADPALVAAVDGQLRLETELREAIEGDGLTLHYQPITDGRGEILSAEALVRWHHPVHGLLSPGAFLPVAEQSDLLPDLDRWVLRTALAEAAGWPTPGGRHPSIAVNLSGLLPHHPEFAAEIAASIDESGIDPRRVVLELVETVLLDLPAGPRRVMEELAEQGVRFAVDDFGTGYSSLARLKDTPTQIIKADRQFVAGLGEDGRDLAIARAVAEFAHALGCLCVAEGVETRDQHDLLAGVGIDAYQGWLFSHALPREEFRDLLGDGRLHR